jgi:hypothetical protein
VTFSTATSCYVTVVSISDGYVEICDEYPGQACLCSQISCGELPNIEPSKRQVATEKDMHKLIIGLMVIFFLGDPSLQTLTWLGEMKLYIVAAAVALVSIPFVSSVLDG